MPTAAVLSLFPQLAALMRFDVLARRESDLGFLLQEACRSAAEGVGAGFAGVLQYRADEQAFVLQAGVGMQARLVGRARVAADLGTTSGLAWHTGQPVHFRHFLAGGRIRMSNAAIGHGVRRLVGVPVHGEGEEMFGVLEVGSAEGGEFVQCDLAFLQELADCIGIAVARHAHQARCTDRATLAAQRLDDPTEPDEQRRGQGGSGRTGRSTSQNVAKRLQPPTFSGLQQDARIQDGSG